MDLLFKFGPTAQVNINRYASATIFLFTKLALQFEKLGTFWTRLVHFN